jgi:TonB family protein
MVCIPAYWAADRTTPVFVIGVGVLRAQAIAVVMPVYPPDSVQIRHSGTAVVEIRISTKGRVTDANVLQAPDDRISKAVETAVRQWTFHPLQKDRADGEPAEFKGRLLFYFTVENGRGVVYDLAKERPARNHEPLAQ